MGARGRLVLVGLAGWLLVFAGPGRALAGAAPLVHSVVEGRGTDQDRPTLVVVGKSLTKFKTFELVHPLGLRVLDAPVLLLRSKSVLALGLQPDLEPGEYDLVCGYGAGDTATFRVSIGNRRPLPGMVEDGSLSPDLRSDLDDAATLGGVGASFFRDASNLDTGTLSTDRFSAFGDLQAEGRVGTGSTQVAAGDHLHDTRYYTQSQLNAAGTLNQAGNPVDWTKLKGVPSGIAGGVGTGSTQVAAGDHQHDTRYYQQTQLNASGGTVNAVSNPVDWSRLKGMPAGFADGADDNAWTEASGNAYRTTGRIGMGTSSPAASLHVAGNDGVLFGGTFGSGTLPATGAGTRMMWYPRKAALRAGYANGSEWDDANIGDVSVAMGYSTTASGLYSTAMGYGTTASGVVSTAMGWNSSATTWTATAMGYTTTASGDNSTAMGDNTTAQAFDSVVLGRWNTVAGTTNSWVSTDPVLVVGNGTGSGARANAFTLLKNGNLGLATSTPAASLHVAGADGALFGGALNTGGAIPAAGSGTRMLWYPKKAAFRAGGVNGTHWDDIVVGQYSVGLGGNTIASGSFSTALGSSTSATANNATALGVLTTASGVGSSAMGVETVASASVSTAMGYNTTATGDNSTSMGDNTTAQAFDSVVLGRWNTVAGTTNSWVSTDPVLVVGNGTGSGARSNAFTLLKNGNLTIAGTLTQSSDLRLKTAVAPLAPVSDRVAALRGVTYRLKADGGDGPLHIGLVAQEVRAAFPELVAEDPDGNLSVAYANLSAVLVEAVKEQKAALDGKDREIASLRAEVEALRADHAGRLARLEALLAPAGER